MTKTNEDRTHEELLALFEEVSRNIDTFKKDNRTYLVYYSAIAGAVITFHKESPATFPSVIILSLLAIGALVCCILIWNNYYKGIKNRRRILGKTIGEFSETFWRCNFDDFDKWFIPNNALHNKDKIFQSAIDREWVDVFIYLVQLLYPLIVFSVTWLFLYPTEEILIEIVGSTIISIEILSTLKFILA